MPLRSLDSFWLGNSLWEPLFTQVARDGPGTLGSLLNLLCKPAGGGVWNAPFLIITVWVQKPHVSWPRPWPVWVGRNVSDLFGLIRLWKVCSPNDTKGAVKVPVYGAPACSFHTRTSHTGRCTEAAVALAPCWQGQLEGSRIEFGSLFQKVYSLVRRFIPWSLELCFLVCSKADHHSGRSVQGNNFMVDRKQREKEYRKRPVQSLGSRDVSLGIYPIQLGPTPYLSPAPNNAIIFSLRDSLFIELELLKV